ncbi:MAG: orange carotenoid protein N-terminal domain-containing protein [Crocosphaera sp.]|nr:orange carotenoid protein N-terminal domain-containing protein [Crocosphaera sp.]
MSQYTEIKSDLNKAAEIFNGFTVDNKLALLWFIYEKMGTSITPAAPNAAEPAIAGGLFEQVGNKSQEQQLQIMRDIVSGADTEYSRQYGGFSANSKLAFWYFLAKGMVEGLIIPMPDKYDLGKEETEWLGTLESLDFNEQITVLREIADSMGVDPTSSFSE